MGPHDEGEASLFILQALGLVAATLAYFRGRRNRKRRVEAERRLPPGGRGGCRPTKEGTARFFWQQGLKAWRLRTGTMPSEYERTYLDTTENWRDVPDNTLYREFRRKFRIPFSMFLGILEDAYDSDTWCERQFEII